MTFQDGASVTAQKYFANATTNCDAIHFSVYQTALGDVDVLPDGRIVVAHGSQYNTVSAFGVIEFPVTAGGPNNDIDIATNGARIAAIYDSDTSTVVIQSWDFAGANPIAGVSYSTSGPAKIGDNAIATLASGAFVGVFEVDFVGDQSKIRAMLTQHNGL